jgi:hypothetical protein
MTGRKKIYDQLLIMYLFVVLQYRKFSKKYGDEKCLR